MAIFYFPLAYIIKLQIIYIKKAKWQKIQMGENLIEFLATQRL